MLWTRSCSQHLTQRSIQGRLSSIRPYETSSVGPNGSPIKWRVAMRLLMAHNYRRVSLSRRPTAKQGPGNELGRFYIFRENLKYNNSEY